MTLSCQGIGINTSREVAIGKAYLLHHGVSEIRVREVAEELIQHEIERFLGALETTTGHLRNVREQIPGDTAPDISEFIDTHLLMLEDAAISQATINLIRENRYSAEWALQVRRDELVRVFDQMDDPYLRTRKDDVEHVVNQIQFVLAGGKPSHSDDLQGRVVVARDLTPAETIMMKNQGIAAFVTEFGGPLSHTAILARSLGIPAVVGIHQATTLLRQGETLVVDGAQGVVLADPTPRILQHYQERIAARAQREADLRRQVDLPTMTTAAEGPNDELNVLGQKRCCPLLHRPGIVAKRPFQTTQRPAGVHQPTDKHLVLQCLPRTADPFQHRHPKHDHQTARRLRDKDLKIGNRAVAVQKYRL